MDVVENSYQRQNLDMQEIIKTDNCGRTHRTRIFSICYKILKYRRKVMFERLREIEIFSDIEKTMKTKSEIVKCVEQRGWMRGKKGCDIAYYYDYGNQYIFIFVYQSKNYR